MNRRIIWAIARKDWREVRQNGMAWKPMLILPLIICVLLPVIIILGPTLFNIPMSSLTKGQDIKSLVMSLPPAVQEQVGGMTDHQLMIYFILAFTLAPMFLILPIMTASIIGSDSFVGEKERKTMESLLYTPATERDLFLGKMLAAVVPAVLVSWITFIVYTVILNVLGGPVMGRVWFPTPTWWPLILWVTPAVAVMGMLGAVLVSSRVSTFMEAYQATGLLVLPVILLLVAQVGGVIYLSVGTTIIVGLVIWLVDAAFLWFSLKIFSRAALMGSAKA
jgi:ABC-type transport system involved in multi-copper enzyme maturation permease subunit